MGKGVRMIKYYVGIDIGLHGAIAIIDSNMQVRNLIDMPLLKIQKGKKIRSVYDISELKQWLSTYDERFIFYIEKSHPFPKINSQANWLLGYGFCLFDFGLLLEGYKYEVVSAKTWQKAFFQGLGRSSSDTTKSLSYQVATRLFPSAELTTKRGRVLDGRSDALLIAEYGRRQHMGGANG